MTRPTIYVAGAVAEVQRAAGVIAQLRDAGFEITHDWPALVLAAPDKHERDMTRDERLVIAEDSLVGVSSAGVMWLLVPSEGRGRGSWVELGYTLGIVRFRDRKHSAPTVIVASGDTLCSAFTEKALVRFATDAEALAWLLGRYEVAA